MHFLDEMNAALEALEETVEGAIMRDDAETKPMLGAMTDQYDTDLEGWKSKVKDNLQSHMDAECKNIKQSVMDANVEMKQSNMDAEYKTIEQSVMDANVEVKQSKMDAVATPIRAGNSWGTKRKSASRARERGNKV